MSVINRIEVGNFLNLEKISPDHSDWRPHWVHNVLNLRGNSAAIVATNGYGKSTINRALYAILTRDREFTKQTKQVCAPKRSGRFTHVRIEMLMRRGAVPPLCGQMGEEVPGEPWVIGFYGNHNEDLNFYYYQGHLKDCPVAERHGSRIRLIANEVFKQTLFQQKDYSKTQSVDDWRTFIGRHFEPAILAQMLHYQKAGGGDSVEHIFKVKDRGIDGVKDPYDAAFFYEHIAPEVLANAMGEDADQDEFHFEDTLIRSVRPLIEVERLQEANEQLLERDNVTIAALAETLEVGDDYQEEVRKLDDAVAELAGEVSFLTEIVETTPIPGVPRVLTERNEEVRAVANGLVYVSDHGWMVPDALIARVWGSDTGDVNRAAGMADIEGVEFRQAIEIPVHPGLTGVGRQQGGGQKSHAYSLDSSRQLLERRTTFADGWDRLTAIRALNVGFEWRIQHGDTNPYRPMVTDAEAQHQAKQAEQEEVTAFIKANRGKLHVLEKNIETMDVAEHHLVQIINSRLFTPEEIEDLIGTGQRTRQHQQDGASAIRAHERKHVELNHVRSCHLRYMSAFPDEASPAAALSRLRLQVGEADDLADDLGGRVGEAASIVSSKEATREAIDHEWKARSDQKAKLDALLEPVNRCEQAFPGEDPVGLEDQVTTEYDEARSALGDAQSKAERSEADRAALIGMQVACAGYCDLFGTEQPEGLEVRLLTRRSGVQSKIKAIGAQLPGLSEQIQVLEDEQHALIRVHENFPHEDPQGLESRLRRRQSEVTQALARLANDRERYGAHVERLVAFRTRFGDVDPLNIQRTRQDRATTLAGDLKAHKNERADAQRQLDELAKSATAAGLMANQVLAAIGMPVKRVHQVLSEELPLGHPHRTELFVHFSHVLHAPVSPDDPATSEAILKKLDMARIEFPVFSEGALRSICRTAKPEKIGGISRYFLVGMQTLQVEGILDPQRIEEMRDTLRRHIAEVDRLIATVTTELAGLADSSAASALVRDAIAAITAEAEANLARVASELEQMTNEAEALAGTLTEEAVKQMRKAEKFLSQNGHQLLAETRAHGEALQFEASNLIAQLPELERLTSLEAIVLIKARLRYEDRGGDARLTEFEKLIEEAESEIAHLSEKLPRLTARRNAVPDIRAAAQFQAMGGHTAIAEAVAALSIMGQRLEEARAAVIEAHSTLEELRRRHTNAMAARETAKVQFGSSEDYLNAAQGYLDSKGPAFDKEYPYKLERLNSELALATRRTGFNFELAAQAQFNTREGRTADDMRRQIKALDQEIQAAEDRRDALGPEISRQADQLTLLRRQAVELDIQIRAVIGFWRSAKRIARSVELTEEMLAKHTAPVSLQSARRALVDIRECDLSEVAERIAELVEGDIRNFKMQDHIRSIDGIRQNRDRYRKDFERKVMALIEDRTKSMSLSEENRITLDRAKEALNVEPVRELHRAFQKIVRDSIKRVEKTATDIKDQRDQINRRLETFTFRLQDNLDLLRRCLKPSAEDAAGFDLRVQAVQKTEVRAIIQKAIDLINTNDRTKPLNLREQHDPNDDLTLKQAMRRVLYRGIFIGTEEHKEPRIYIRHPTITNGRSIPMDEKVSTGQSNALALMLLTKMSDFAMRRDERFYMYSAGRKRGNSSNTRVVMIDGLFSNLSDPTMIRASLEAVRSLTGKFQLIGWIHNMNYQNDPEIFPEHLGVRRIGNGLVVTDTYNDVEEGFQPAQIGDATILEMHADRIPQLGPQA